MPVVSLMRLAARPVGAASKIFIFLDLNDEIMPFTVVVLPVPGPPVSTITLAARALSIASCCTVS